MKQLLSNYILLSAVLGWLSAQLIKFISILVVTGRVDFERLFGAGGMPSAHTAMVCATTVAAARMCGVGSPTFAVCFILACIVMYDATGVRRAAGEQARVINWLIKKEEEEEELDSEEFTELKEKLGHTPLEVLAGALLGILIPLMLGFIYF